MDTDMNIPGFRTSTSTATSGLGGIGEPITDPNIIGHPVTFPFSYPQYHPPSTHPYFVHQHHLEHAGVNSIMNPEGGW